MAAKPELSPAPGVQNVVVYVSNDNFAQAYSINQPNAPPDYPPAPIKSFYPDKAAPQPPQGYYIAPNGGYGDADAYAAYVAAMGGPAAARCDSARSEAAESSCSSLSSADEGLTQHLQPPEMVVYDPSVSVRPASACVSGGGGNGLVYALAPHHQQFSNSTSVNNSVGTISNQLQQFISVPYGWKRIINNNGAIIYISPSNTALSSAEQVKDYLLSAGTCKCGLECPFKYDNTFNFDPKVMGKPWTLSPDTNLGDLTKLCNHKRKIIAMASLDCKPPDPAPGHTIVKQRKDHAKKTKRKIGMPYPMNQSFSNKSPQYPKEVWPQSPTSTSHRPYQAYQPLNPDPSRPLILGDGNVLVQSNISHQVPPPPPPQQQQQNQIQLHHQHIIGPNGQVISVQGPALNANGTPNVVLQQQHHHHHQQQQHQRVFINQPNEPSGPGRPPNGMMMPQRFYHQPQAYGYDPSKVRPGFIPNGFRPQQQQHNLINNQLMQAPVLVNNNNNNPKWPPRPNNYERVPPLHQHTPNLWQHEEIKRKKVKLGKVGKNRPYHVMECQPPPCPNIDVRQIPNENGRAIILNQQQQVSNGTSPSFLEDPSGYLAQQTALLNNTINRQTMTGGCVGLVCNSPVTSTAEVPLPSNVVVPHKSSRNNQIKQYNQMIVDSSDHNNCQGCKSRPTSSGSTTTDDPVTSSNYLEKHQNQASPDSRPIQGGTVSTSNVSPMESDHHPPHTPTPPQISFTVYNQAGQVQQVNQCSSTYLSKQAESTKTQYVTTMASGRTVGSNTITSVLAGRANTATVSINSPAPGSPGPQLVKSPLEMVQSVVSSIQVPSTVKPGHIFVSSGGQLIMAGGNQSMPPPPPKLVTSMPPMSVSPMITNVTAAMSQVIPAVAQQVLGQQTVLVNALPAPFVLQPMTMELPQIVTGNVMQQLQQQPEVKKKGKKRKMPTVANMLLQQNPGMVTGFHQQQIQMAPNPTPVMIVPSKNGLVQQQIIANHHPQQINLLQPVNLINGGFPTIQQFIMPNLVMNPDGTATLLQEPSNLGMQLQLQNVNGQNVLTQVPNFNAGMVIRPQGKLVPPQQQHSPQFLSPNGGQFVVNGAQLSPLAFGGQQTLMVPVSSANATFVQQNTTIVQQQTTMLANNGQNGGKGGSFIINDGNGGKMQAILQVREPTAAAPGAFGQASVSTQTAVGQNAGSGSVTTFCQTSLVGGGGSPPDTTTGSPGGGQGSPHTADTTTHSGGSTDDGLSPTPSNNVCDSERQHQSCTMAMVHCISSSEPDAADLNTQIPDHDWSRVNIQQKTDLHGDITTNGGSHLHSNHHHHQIHHFKKSSSSSNHNPNNTNLAYAAESSTMVSNLQFIEQMKAQEAVISSHNFDKMMHQKRKSSDTLLVMETQHMHSSLFDEGDKVEKDKSLGGNHEFVVGDLVWGPAHTYPAWPGKIIDIIDDDDAVTVKWFGYDRLGTKLDKLNRNVLQTLTEGLDAHHQARKKTRTSRKLNANLEKAIQEAMAELDKKSETKTSKTNRNSSRSLRNR